MTEVRYPSLFYESDRAAIAAQRRYVMLRYFQIGSVMASAALSLAGVYVSHRAIAAFLLVGPTFTLFIGLLRVDRTWFQARAIAESIKKQSWLYMMRISPFDGDAESADAAFVDSIRGLRDLPDVIMQLPVSTEPIISSSMREIRGAGFKERRDLYEALRFRDQLAWYLSKAKSNKSIAQKWFAGITFVQVLAFVLAVALESPFVVAPVATLTTVSAGLMALAEIGRYNELAGQYSIAANELRLLESRASSAVNEEHLQTLVSMTEDRISREHTLWTLRRIP